MLYITEGEVDSLLTMRETMEAVRKGFQLQAGGGVESLPRTRVKTPGGTLNVMPVTVDGIGLSGLKVYYANRTGISFLVTLFSVEDAQPLCTIEANRLGQLRTGAASGVMTDLMSARNASVVGCIGAGYQAETQIQAVSEIRSIDRVLVKARSVEKMNVFAEMMTRKYGINTTPVSSTSELREVDILITATTSHQPVISEKDVPDACHINAIGANQLRSSELETATFCSAKIIAVDSLQQGMMESGDLVNAVNSGGLRVEHVNEAWEVVAGKGRKNLAATKERTIFKSLGIGLEDLVTAKHVYERAREKGMGKKL